jgi:hypothetical protein
MDHPTQYPGTTNPQGTPLRPESQYPDPEASDISGIAWPASTLPYGVEKSTAAPFQSDNQEAFSLENARAEFESASTRQRGRSREQSDESDFLKELSDDE